MARISVDENGVSRIVVEAVGAWELVVKDRPFCGRTHYHTGPTGGARRPHCRPADYAEYNLIVLGSGHEPPGPATYPRGRTP
jgi:hypothetical protein